MTVEAYPLQWPEGWKRTSEANRRYARFTKSATRTIQYTTGSHSYRQQRALTVSEAVGRVLTELQRMVVDRQDVVISTNVRTRLDGLPRSDAKRPTDPGVAVYWQEMNGARRVMAIDQYTTVEDNLAAIAATLEAMRAIERHGGAAILERAFTGFVALPPPAAEKHWREVLGVMAVAPNLDQLKAAYRAAASAAHPDRQGGSDARMAAVNVAYEQAKKECGL
jgi:hypothetical protein